MRPDGITADSWQEWPHNRWAYHHVDEVLRTAVVPRSSRRLDPFRPGPSLDVPGLDAELDALSTDGLLVLRGRDVVLETYPDGMAPTAPHLLQSVSKSLVSAVLARVVAAGGIDLGRTAAAYVPRLSSSVYGVATLQQVLDMTVAVAYSEAYADPDSELQQHDRAAGWRALRPGERASIKDFLTTLQPTGEQGVRFQYCSANTDVLAWVLEEVTGRPLSVLLATELWEPLGAEHDALVTVDAEGFVLASGGVCVTVRDLARFGRMLLDGGRAADGVEVVPAAWVDDLRRGGSLDVDRTALPERMQATGSYHDQLWFTGDEHRCFFGVGIYGQLVWMNPVTDVVVAKVSSLPAADDPAAFDAHRVLMDRLSVLAAG